VKPTFPSRLASMALDAFSFGDRAPLAPLCAAPTYIDWIRSVYGDRAVKNYDDLRRLTNRGGLARCRRLVQVLGSKIRGQLQNPTAVAESGLISEVLA
jgi:hypothetical protein